MPTNKIYIPPSVILEFEGPGDTMGEGFIVFDLETTCDRGGKIPRFEQEIIEIGAVIWDQEANGVIDSFQNFVRPMIHPELSDYCLSLTGIKQRQVDRAQSIEEAMIKFATWFGQYRGFTFTSWGDFDIEMVTLENNRYGIEVDFQPHLNLKNRAKNSLKLNKSPGLRDALKYFGHDFDGKHHRALDDAENIAKLIPFLCHSENQ